MFNNDETKRNIVFIVIIILVMVLSYILFPISHTRAPSQNPIQQSNHNSTQDTSSLGTKTKNIREDAPSSSYVINVQYPEIINLGNQQNQDELNQAIANYVADKISDFQKKAEKMGVIKNKKSSLNIDYSVLFLNKELTSLKFNIFEDWANADYSNNYSLTLNYDIANQSAINIDNIFKPESDYLNVLSNKLSSSLMDSMPGAHGVSGVAGNPIGQWIEEKTTPFVNNFQNFGFDDKNLIFYFNTNESEFYTLGTQIVTISYKSIKNYLDTSGSLARLIEQIN